MESRLLKTIIGVAMVAAGLVQISLFAVQSEWIPTGFGIFYALLGTMYLWSEVYTSEQ